MIKLSKLFGSKVFNDSVMKERLPKATYKALRETTEDNKPLGPDVAEVVAAAMKDWAIEMGATHYTHWFQPMTGITAEKHDSFISPTKDGKVILEFSGKELIKGEPDASSFPSGGIRATFEARGYTAWDCTSPAFIKDDTLCIPTAFCSYTGEALDKKTPLLRSMDAISAQGMRVLRALGNTTATKIISNVGPEQEYFLIDKEYFEARKDIKFTGRTLFGAMAPKGQEMEDHYFGSIKGRIIAFMKDLDEELWKLGIPAKTRHNEVAPAQYELAPIYGTTNLATDQNQLLMETLKKVAINHDLACLLHEKPFAGVNGSGKHNNWSIGTDDGQNLLEPGKDPHENKQFLLFLSAVIKAVDVYADALRSSAATPGNDHRLGANEAPPAIISMFLGDQLDDIVQQIIKTGTATSSKVISSMELGATTLPIFAKDNSDRNRTSPFAFTGNKFEFRMVGSSASIAGPNFILNTAVAEILSEIADRLEKAADVNAEVAAITKEYMTDHQRIIFNGNNYSDEWVVEAEKRGLPNTKNLVDSKKALLAEKNVKMLAKHKVLSEVETHSRYEILLENYIKTINIEALTAIEMTKRDYIPAVISFITTLANSINAVKATGVDAVTSAQSELLVATSSLVASAKAKVEALEKAVQVASSIEDVTEMAVAYRDKVFVSMNSLREDIDTLETMVDADYWPVPSYGEMLFSIQ